jgi:site-specific DNA-methyltransferase (adenine-specific)
MKNRIINGDCTEVLKAIAAESVDFALTDPPYFVRYMMGDNRKVRPATNKIPEH